MIEAATESDFVALFEKHGPAETARILGVSERSVHNRRVNLERKMGRQITAQNSRTRFAIEHPQRHVLEITDGWGIIGSDAHYWPKRISTAHRAFVHFAKRQPSFIVMNGDVLDASSISRFPPIGWEDIPTLVDEVETSKERLGEIEKSAPNAKKVWTLGNHDGRFETRLATVAPEYAKLHGVHLKDHFPYWHPCWSCWINPDGQHPVVVKHRYKGGMHSPQNNTLWAGCTVVTGHDHALRVMPISDYFETRWGVNTGTLADPYGPQFRDYTEDNPKNHRSGFVVLTWRGGKLMWPELVYVINDTHVGFRGEVIEV